MSTAPAYPESKASAGSANFTATGQLSRFVLPAVVCTKEIANLRPDVMEGRVMPVMTEPLPVMVTTACTPDPSTVVRFSVWLPLALSVSALVLRCNLFRLALSAVISLAVRMPKLPTSQVMTLQVISSEEMSSQSMSAHWMLPTTLSLSQVTLPDVVMLTQTMLPSPVSLASTRYWKVVRLYPPHRRAQFDEVSSDAPR